MLKLVDAIDGFLQAIEYGGSGDAFLQSCIAAERELRQIFAREPGNFIIKSPYVGLFDIFDLPLQSRLARPREWDSPDDEFIWEHGDRVHRFPSKHILSVKPYLRRRPGTPCTVDKLSDFLETLNAFSGGALSAIKDWDNLFLAGGAALVALEPLFDDPSMKELFKIHQSRTYRNSDIDLFLWGLNEEQVANFYQAKLHRTGVYHYSFSSVQAKVKMQRIFEAINSSLPWDVVCFRTKNTITIQGR